MHAMFLLSLTLVAAGPPEFHGDSCKNLPSKDPTAMSTATITQDRFGTTADGTPVDRYTLRNRQGLTARLITYGATLTELRVPDRQAKLGDVVLGFDSLAPYEGSHPYFGCVVGRVAFRTAEGKFTLDGHAYQLTLNAGAHHIHGGTKGFNRAVWKAVPVDSADAPAVEFRHQSPDGDQGYPGTLEVTVRYTLTPHNELRIDYAATTDRPTVVNLTQHSYFNLAGAGAGDVLGHVVQIDADRYAAVDDRFISTGQLPAVEGTPLDFRRPTAIGARRDKADGYDLCYLHNHPDGALARVATVSEPATGRTMEVLTTEPALIFYTGNALDGTIRGKGSVVYGKQTGFCMETGRPPDAMNHAGFPGVVVRPGQPYRHTCVYRFSVH